MSKWPQLPTSLPTGSLAPHMSARRLRESCETVYEMLGGDERLHDEANRSPDAYWEFMKLRAKATPRETINEHHLSENSVEELMDKLAKAERDGMIDVTPREVEDAA